MPTDDAAARVAEIRARHQPDPRLFWFAREDGSRDEFHYCEACGTGSDRWPCETAVVLAALAAAEQRATRLAALEQAARRCRLHGRGLRLLIDGHADDAEAQAFWAAFNDLDDAVMTLAALAAPPGEGA